MTEIKAINVTNDNNVNNDNNVTNDNNDINSVTPLQCYSVTVQKQQNTS